MCVIVRQPLAMAHKNNNTRVSVERLRELFRYEPETGLLWRIQSIHGCCRLDKPTGSPGKYGYLVCTVDQWTLGVHRIAWAMHYGRWPDLDIDHINGITSDNRISNLRNTTGSQNSINQRMRSNNTSGVKGVCWAKKSSKWRAQITVNQRVKYIGEFGSIDDAKAAYEKAAIEHYGEFMRRTP